MELTIEQLRERESILIAKERQRSKGRTSFWYLSYAGEKFNGGCIVRAFGFIHACNRARALKINPGGQIVGHLVPADQVPPAQYLHKCLTKAELEQCFGKMSKLSELEKES